MSDNNHSGQYLGFTIYTTIFAVGFFVLAYFNCKWFPEKERNLVTLKIYYQSGREAIKTYKLPKGAKLSLMNSNTRSSLLSIWYHNYKPFGMEYGYLEMGVNDFDIIKVKPDVK